MAQPTSLIAQRFSPARIEKFRLNHARVDHTDIPVIGLLGTTVEALLLVEGPVEVSALA